MPLNRLLLVASRERGLAALRLPAVQRQQLSLPLLFHAAQAAGHGAERCFIFEGNEPGRQGEATYEEALAEVCRVVRARAGDARRQVVGRSRRARPALAPLRTTRNRLL